MIMLVKLIMFLLIGIIIVITIYRAGDYKANEPDDPGLLLGVFK